jgi:hypothetical protein
MSFKISGIIREKESNLGVPGLLVRAWDKDLLFDDLLGTAITNDGGFFEIIYFEEDFRKLFDVKPDVYLSIYAPPGRLLLDSTDAVRFSASKEEYFELEIDRKTLGYMGPTLPDDEIEGRISLADDAVKIEKRWGFDIPKLPGLITEGVPGAPALPEQVHFVLLPPGGKVISIDITPGNPVRVPGEVNPFPVQDPIPDVGPDLEQSGIGLARDKFSAAFTPLSPKYFLRKKPYPKNLVELAWQGITKAIRIVAVRVRPLQFDPDARAFVLFPNLRYKVKFDLEEARRHAAARCKKEWRIGYHALELINALVQQERVVTTKHLLNPLPPSGLQRLPGIIWPDIAISEGVPHVIITDNHSWPESIDCEDGTTRPPNADEYLETLKVDPVNEFERLAEWKTARGVRSRVVTIEEILSGQLGDFTESGFALDLQEVLRNFIKYIHTYWNTIYLLIGGDINIIPMRKLIGCIVHWEHNGCERDINCRIKRDGTLAKLHPFFDTKSTDPLYTFYGGSRVPFNLEADREHPGWYYTLHTEYQNQDDNFTRLSEDTGFVIVEGPESIVDDDYYWVNDWNSIPSDLYYASLIGDDYSIPGRHDFDSNFDGLYGQYSEDDDGGGLYTLDGLDFMPDVWVGRAPVRNGLEAKSFVEKVVSYESLESPAGNHSTDVRYLNKILYAADCWFYKHYSEYTGHESEHTAVPEVPGCFTHASGTNVTKLWAKVDISFSTENLSHQLIAVKENTYWEVPYNHGASSENLGWYFVDHTYSTRSNDPTRYLKIVGAEAQIYPEKFFLEKVGLEQASKEKEDLRVLMNEWYPAFDSVQRYYKLDYAELSTPPTLIPLTDTNISEAINDGIHFLSLSGHGSTGGCCEVGGDKKFSNYHKYFIAFAEACDTGRPDNEDKDSLAQKTICNPNGGAVVYIGNTRSSWIGKGAKYERFFWEMLKEFSRTGPAAGFPPTMIDYNLWTFYSQTLFGDPEMPVWTDIPSYLKVTHPDSVEWGETFRVGVRGLRFPRDVNPSRLRNCLVTLMGGWANSSENPDILVTKITGLFGNVIFSLPSLSNRISELKIIATHPGFKPYVGRIEISD